MPVFVYTIIGVTVLVTALAFRDRGLLERLIFDPRAILGRGEWYRVVSSGFIHLDLRHVFFNMFSLYFFGPVVEGAAGPLPFLVIYFASLVGGSLISLWIHRNQVYRALGASGAVSGIIFAAIFMAPGGSVFIFPIPVPIPSWLYAIAFVVISAYGVRSPFGNIGHDAHLGGAVIGLLTATVMYPVIALANPVLWVAVVGITVGFFVFLLRRPPGQPKPGLPRGRATGVHREPPRLHRIQSEEPEVQVPDDPEDRQRLREVLEEKLSRVGWDRMGPREQRLLERLRWGDSD